MIDAGDMISPDHRINRLLSSRPRGDHCRNIRRPDLSGKLKRSSQLRDHALFQPGTTGRFNVWPKLRRQFHIITGTHFDTPVSLFVLLPFGHIPHFTVADPLCKSLQRIKRLKKLRSLNQVHRRMTNPEAVLRLMHRSSLIMNLLISEFHFYARSPPIMPGVLRSDGFVPAGWHLFAD